MTERNFLDVERSLSGRRWTPRLRDERLAQAIAEQHELPEILGRVMAARGVGLDEDHPVHRYFLAAKHHEFLLGNATDQLRALGKELAAVPA